MKKFNCLGDACPVPVLKLMEMRPLLDGGEQVMIVTDHSCTCQSLLSYCRTLRYPVRVVEPINGIWEVTVMPRENAGGED